MSAESGILVDVRSSGRRPQGREPSVRNLLVLGDFGGGPAIAEGGALRAHAVAPGGIDAALEAAGPSIELLIETPVHIDETLTLESLDDFHPDRLLVRCAALRTLLALRARLEDPATAEQASRALAELVGTAPSDDAARAAANGSPEGTASVAASGDRATTSAPGSGADDDVFERLLGRKGDGPGRQRRIVDELIRTALAETPSATAAPPRAALERCDDIVASALRAVLAAPRLRALEAAWRGLDWLVSEVDEASARIALVDVSREALAAMLDGPPETLETSGLGRLLEESHGDGATIVAGLYTFGPDVDDLVLLAKLGALAARNGATFVAHGDLALCGAESGAESIVTEEDLRAWRAPGDAATKLFAELRAHPAARSVRLASPRFLLRHPYGPRSNPIDAFDFTELTARPGRERFCWGNPALVAAAALAAGTDRAVVAGLPMPLYDDGTGGHAQQPPTEVMLGDGACARVQASGLSVLRCNRTTGDVVIDVRALALHGDAPS